MIDLNWVTRLESISHFDDYKIENNLIPSAYNQYPEFIKFHSFDFLIASESKAANR